MIKFKINERARLVNDWLSAEAKAKQVVITKLRSDGYAEIRWTGSNSKLITEQFGTIFPLDELRKV